MRRWCRLVLLGLCLALFAASAFAYDGNASNYIGTVDNDTSAGVNNDLSIIYLGQMFGTVGSVLHGSAGQLISSLFLKFNQGIVGIALAWIVYTTGTLLIKGVTESLAQQQSKVFLIFLRIAFGMAILIPLPTGYNAFQSVVMWVVVKGVDLADSTWSHALDYMGAGGVLYSPAGGSVGTSMNAGQAVASGFLGLVGASSAIGGAEGGASGNATTTLNNADASGFAFIVNLLQVMSCMDMSNLYNTYYNNHPNEGYRGQYGRYNYWHSIDPASGHDNFKYDFPGIPNDPAQANTGAACGSVSWNDMTDGNYCQTLGGNSGTNAMLCQTQKSALAQVMTDLSGASMALACSGRKTSGMSQCSAYKTTTFNSQTNLDQPFMSCTERGDKGGYSCQTNRQEEAVVTGVKNAYLDLFSLMASVARYKNSTGNDDLTQYKSFIAVAKQNGWVTAGMFYWNLIMLNDQMMAQSTGIHIYANAVVNQGGDKSHFWSSDDFYNGVPGLISRKSPESAYVTAAVSAINGQNAANSNAATHGRNNQASNDSAVNVIVRQIMNLVTAGLASIPEMWATFEKAGGNPMVFISQIGNVMLNAVSGFYITGPLIIGLLSAIAYICASTSPAGYVLTAIVEFITPIFTMVMILFLASGILLSYYVPLYPYIVYTFAVVGWIILVFESMLAAPLVGLGLTHPEGHDFMGKAEQSLMLLLGVFLRPALMVFGLIGGIILSYVGFNILVLGFHPVVSAAIDHDPNVKDGDSMLSAGMAIKTAGLLLSMFASAFLIVIFGIISKGLVEMCYSTVFQVPAAILRWIGGPQMQDSGEQFAKQTASSFGQFASSVSKAPGEATSGMKSQAQGAARDKQQRDGSDSSADDQEGGKGETGGGESRGGGGGGS